MNGRVWWVLAAAASSACLLGCPNPNTYGTPRTTPSGKLQHTIALEGFHLASTVKTAAVGGTPTAPTITEQEKTNSVTFPSFPTYQLRIGLGDRVDLGARIANLSSLGLDVKWNFMRTPGFDLAVDPGAQVIYFSSSSGGASSSIFLLYGHLPLIAGINFGESMTLVVAGGLVSAFASGTASSSSDREATVGSGGGVGLRGGMGFQVRTSKSFAIHPEINVMRFLTGNAGDSDLLAITFGLGFNFGTLPSHAPDEGEEKPAEPKPADPKPADPKPAETAPAPAP